MQRIFDFLIGAGILQGFFLAIYLWRAKKSETGANRVLSILMCAFALNLLHSLLRIDPPPFMPSGGMIEPFQPLLAPLLFLFLRARVDGKPLALKDAIHGIPFVLTIFLLPFKPQTDIGNGSAIMAQGAPILFWAALFLQISAYFVVCFLRVRRFNHSIAEYYSETRQKDLRWMNAFMVVFLLLYAGYLSLFFIFFHTGDKAHFERLLSFLQSMAVYGLGAFALFIDVPVPTGLMLKASDSRKKPPLPQDSLDGMKNTLAALMDSRKFFLDPELTLPELAARTGIPRNALSQLINEGFGKNFYDFVNSYRTEEFIRLMREDKRKSDKILTLAFDAGFASKPAFNAAFRKITGKTPSDYKKSMK